MWRSIVLTCAGVVFFTLLLWITGIARNPVDVGKQTGGEANASQETIYLNGAAIRVTVVDTPELRQKGLSGRGGLEPDEGMLFVFPEDGVYAFWMKDMLFSIDIVWISAEGKIVHIAKSVSPSTYPTSFEPPLPVRYVLELPAGYTDQHKIAIGDIVRL